MIIQKLNRCCLLIFLFTICISLGISPSSAASSITLEEFRWKKNNLDVLVEMNNASTFECAAAVHKALDSWTECISIYINSFNDEVLETLTFGFYVDTINYTSSYDIYVTFTPYEIPEGSGAIGQTNYRYNLLTHEPIPPINITITTYSATASSLFIQNIAMHELGHAIGLGHASPEKTDDGDPELMYYRTMQNVAIYPSTLDVYGLSMLYRNNFNKPVQLPRNISYKMLLYDNVTPTPFPSPSPVPTLTPTPQPTFTITPTPTLTPTPQPTTTPMNSPTATPKPTLLPTSTTILIQIPLIPVNYQTLIILTTIVLAVVGLLLVLFTRGQTIGSNVLSNNYSQ